MRLLVLMPARMLSPHAPSYQSLSVPVTASNLAWEWVDDLRVSASAKTPRLFVIIAEAARAVEEEEE